MDLDAFFASVEQLDHPEWRGQPVIVGGSAERRGVVSTCSYEARKFGVHSAMAAAQARRLCPQAIWTHGHFERYIEVSRQVMGILLNHSPQLEQCSIDEAFLDVTPGPRLGGDPVAVAEAIQAEVATLGISCSIGLGTNKTVAKIASDMDKPRGLTVVTPGTEREFLAPLPLAKMSGLGSKSVAKLNRLGLRTLGDLASADEALLRPIFGKNTHSMRLRAGGQDSSPVASSDTVKSVSNEVSFATNLTTAEEIRQAIYLVAQKTGRRLRAKGLKGHTVCLKVRYNDLSYRSAQRGLGRNVDNEADFIDVLYELLPGLWQPGDELRLVGVAVSGFEDTGGGRQLSLFDLGVGPETSLEAANGERDSKSPGRPPRRGRATDGLVAATDRVKNRFGDAALKRGRELRFESRLTGTPARPTKS
jgi:DNA polymerase-4